MSNIKMFRSISGEDIIGEFVEIDSEGNSVYKNTIQLVVVPSKQNPTEQTYAFAAFPQYAQPNSDLKVRFNSNLISFYIDVDEQFLDQYNSIFGNIIAPEPKILL